MLYFLRIRRWAHKEYLVGFLFQKDKPPPETSIFEVKKNSSKQNTSGGKEEEKPTFKLKKKKMGRKHDRIRFERKNNLQQT